MHARKFIPRSIPLLLLPCLAVPAFLPAPSVAQVVSADSPWGLRVRAVLSGSSDKDTAGGYTVYSGVALEAALVRRVSDGFALELSMRTESREVTGPARNLGSLEMIPLTVSGQWRPRGSGDAPWQPYLGAGVNVTGTWEKSGDLDSAHVTPKVGPALVVGSDWLLGGRSTLNLDVRWNTLRVEMDHIPSPPPSIKVDPLALGVGVGVRF